MLKLIYYFTWSFFMNIKKNFTQQFENEFIYNDKNTYLIWIYFFQFNFYQFKNFCSDKFYQEIFNVSKILLKWSWKINNRPFTVFSNMLLKNKDENSSRQCNFNIIMLILVIYYLLNYIDITAFQKFFHFTKYFNEKRYRKTDGNIKFLFKICNLFVNIF